MIGSHKIDKCNSASANDTDDTEDTDRGYRGYTDDSDMDKCGQNEIKGFNFDLDLNLGSSVTYSGGGCNHRTRPIVRRNLHRYSPYYFYAEAEVPRINDHRGNVNYLKAGQTQCAYCRQSFKSRNKLFQHLRSKGVDTRPGRGRKRGAQPYQEIEQLVMKFGDMKICSVSGGIWTKDSDSDSDSSEIIQPTKRARQTPLIQKESDGMQMP